MGFSVKKRDMRKLELFSFQKKEKNPHKKEGQSQRKWDSSVFDSTNRDCPSKIGTVGEYDFEIHALVHPVACNHEGTPMYTQH